MILFEGDALTSLSFTIPGEPVPRQEPEISRRGGKVRMVSHPKTRAGIAAVATWVRSLDLVRQPINGPVKLSVTFWCAYPASFAIWKREAGDDYYNDTRPDYSNYVKLLEDGLTASGIWADDGRVAGYGEGWKRYSDRPRTEVELTILEQATLQSVTRRRVSAKC